MKKLVFLLLILILTNSFFSGCIKKGNGTLLLMITDKPPELNITKAVVTITSISAHRVGIGNNYDNESSAGWIMLINDSKTFDLILLRNVSDILGEVNISVGVYSQLRLYVENALITIDGVEYDLKIPSKKVKIVSNFVVFEDEITTLLLDFDIHKSVHRAGKDKYILKPVIKLK